jgi:hypothetical protein
MFTGGSPLPAYRLSGMVGRYNRRPYLEVWKSGSLEVWKSESPEVEAEAPTDFRNGFRLRYRHTYRLRNYIFGHPGSEVREFGRDLNRDGHPWIGTNLQTPVLCPRVQLVQILAGVVLL